MQKELDSTMKTYLLPLCFLSILFFHFADQLFDIMSEGENTENRILAERPTFQIDNLDAYPKKFDDYYNDHFKWRNQLIGAYNQFNYFILNRSALPDEVLRGKDGWLYMTDGLDLCRGKEQFTKSELESINRELVFRNDFIQKRGGKYYLVVIPQKQSVYEEYLPEYVNKINPKTATDNLIDYLQQNSNLVIVNLKDSLRSKKHLTSIPIFYKTDHHWNPYGGLLAAQSILNRIQTDFSNLDTMDISDYEFELVNQPGRVTARMLKLENQLMEDNPIVHYSGDITLDTIPNDYPVPAKFPYKDEYVINVRSSQAEAPSMLMVRESFGVQLIPVLSNYFSESTYVFDFWEHSLNPQIVEDKKPDIYIQMVYEKLLKNLLVNQSSN